MDVDLKDWGIISAMLLAWGGIGFAVMRALLTARIDAALASFEERVVDPIRGQLQRIELETVKVATWLEMSKARAASRGRAEHNSPYEIGPESAARLGEMIEATGYVADPVMVAEFRRLVDDPFLPDDDVVLWSIIEGRFGLQALAQECQRFGAEPDEAPGIWVMCIRRAQVIGAEALLREIKVIR